MPGARENTPPVKLTIQPTSERDLGPAMLKLTPLQRNFVQAWFMIGGNATQAVRAAGYEATEGADRVIGHNLMHNPKIKAAIREYADTVVNTEHLVLAAKTITRLMTDPAVEHAVQASVAKTAMATAGFAPKTEHAITVTHRTEAEIDSELLALATEMGMSDEQKARLIGRPVVTVTDAVVIEEGTPSMAGLEDLL